MSIAGPMLHLFWFFFFLHRFSHLTRMCQVMNLALLLEFRISLCYWKFQHNAPSDNISASTGETDWSFYQLVVSVFTLILFLSKNSLISTCSFHLRSKIKIAEHRNVRNFYATCLCLQTAIRGSTLLEMGRGTKYPLMSFSPFSNGEPQ